MALPTIGSKPSGTVVRVRHRAGVLLRVTRNALRRNLPELVHLLVDVAGRAIHRSVGSCQRKLRTLVRQEGLGFLPCPCVVALLTIPAHRSIVRRLVAAITRPNSLGATGQVALHHAAGFCLFST